MTNLILATDSYKINHFNQYQDDTENVYSYFESRNGAKFPYTVFFGLQYIIEKYLLEPITMNDIQEAKRMCEAHFGDSSFFNEEGWLYILNEYDGKLPLLIKAVPEGTAVPTGNVLMTVENTDEKVAWLTNFVESLLTHVWYPSTVATLSRFTKETIKHFLAETADNDYEGIDFMLHDFGYRGVSSHESAEIGGLAHLVNFKGTDTISCLPFGQRYYEADLANLAFSVPATEHSIMTSLGEEGEHQIVDQLIKEYPNGILSVVADSYDYYGFLEYICNDPVRQSIQDRDGTFVVRPDSVTDGHTTPHALVVATADKLFQYFGGHFNTKDYKVINKKVKILWGDGIDFDGITEILAALAGAGYSAKNIVFGMGGGLLQKVNRDTQRFAFKCSAQKRGGEWIDVSKNPLDKSKASKAGRLKLSEEVDINDPSRTKYVTNQEWVAPHDHVVTNDVLETVFVNGSLQRRHTFEEVRANAAI